MQCSRCNAGTAQFPFGKDFLCGKCLIKERGIVRAYARNTAEYQRLMEEAQVEYDAWETRFIARLAARWKHRGHSIPALRSEAA